MRVALPFKPGVGPGRRDPDVCPLLDERRQVARPPGKRAWTRVVPLLLLLGCAHQRDLLPLFREVTTAAGPLRIEAANEDDAAAVRRAAIAAAPSLSRWGAFDAPVRIRVVPNHQQLEEESGMKAVGWLRAWARPEGIILQRPATWSVFGARASDIEELLRHELTHVLTYQLARSPQKMPLWFREGMAMSTANQGYRFASLEDLARFYRSSRSDPLREPELFYRNQSGLLYAASLHAFSFLVSRYGDACVTELLAQMRDGRSFSEAFNHSVGISEEAFLRDFERYVRLRAFKSGRPFSSTPDDSSQ